MNIYRLYILISFLFTSGIVHASNTYTGGNDYYTISKITPFSTVEPLNPNWAGKTQVKFTSNINWQGGGGCNTDVVAIHEGDNHFSSIIMQAFAMGKPIRLYGENNHKVSGTDVCILRAIDMKQ